MKPRILFDKKSLPFILKAIGKSIDKNGYIIDKKTKEIILDIDGNKVKANKLIGIYKDKWITKSFQILLVQQL